VLAEKLGRDLPANEAAAAGPVVSAEEGSEEEANSLCTQVSSAVENKWKVSWCI
jgi:hypothetical protein